MLILLNIVSLAVFSWMTFRTPSEQKYSHEELMQVLQEELNLNQEQSLKISDIQRSMYAEQKKAETDMRDAQRLVNDAMLSRLVDTSEVRRLTELVGQRESQKEWLKYQKFEMIREELRSDQQDKLLEIMREIGPMLSPPPDNSKKD